MHRLAERSWWSLVVIGALALGGGACGGAGGGAHGVSAVGARTSISTDVSSVKFVVGAQVGASSSQTITFKFRGDGVVAGYAPGVAVAPWLSVTTTGTTTADTASFELTAQVPPTGLVGREHATSLRFATGRLPPGANLSQATDVVFVDIAVELTVSDLAVAPANLALSVLDGSGASPAPADARAFSISGTAAWTATSDASWLALSQSAGTAPSQLGFTVNADGLSAGLHVANLEVRDADLGQTTRVTVSLEVTVPQLTTSTDVLELSVDAATTRQQLSRSLTVSDELDGRAPGHAVTWTVQSVDAPWVVAGVTPAAGSSAPPTTLSVTLDPAQLDGLANGDHAATLTLASVTKDGQPHTTAVKLILHLKVPRVQWAAPSVVYAGRAQEVILRGTGLGGVAGQPVMFGATAAAAPAVIGDGELRVPCPALPVGDVMVQIPNSLGLTTTSARLVVRSAGALPAAVLGIAGRKRRVFFDDERQVLYGVDIDAATLSRVALRGGAWTVLPGLTVEKLQDAAISTDGRTLVLATLGAGIFELDLTDANATPRHAAASDQLFSSLAFTNHGLAVLTTTLFGSGDTQVYSYDVARKQISPVADKNGPLSLYLARAYASGDGRLVLLAQNGLSPPPPLVSFDAATDHAQNTPIERNVSQVSLNRDASKLVVDGTLYDRSYNVLGHLGGELRVLLSPDGSRAYASTYDPGTAKPTDFVVYDLTTSPGAANAYPRLSSIPLAPWLKDSPDIYPPMMAISGDGLTLFIWAEPRSRSSRSRRSSNRRATNDSCSALGPTIASRSLLQIQLPGEPARGCGNCAAPARQG